ncbi:hypothetical protein PLESTB_000715800 [Pleodorina starrii]|uniref:Uncharacterized protein n=1 Tax=Pleodorina starrii TaxID=330485 RepID=A0A9W6BJ52_9CHLO|nr:hypothetical protein PLESTB_000715800 [Pleodorina starrii]GLC68626.1 hypothetical protein PLESTF_000716400 [Pleodorina starrii]
MYQTKSFRQRQTALGRQACGRPSRRALQATCLHKALRTPSAGPITAPADVVYECLTLLRRPDLESLTPFFPPASFDPAVRCVGLPVGGEVVEEAGPLACCHLFMDTAARRVLPGHLLRRCRVLSSVQLPGGTCTLRVALTARTGEEAVFVWRLRRLTAPAREQRQPVQLAGADDAGPESGQLSRESQSESESESESAGLSNSSSCNGTSGSGSSTSTSGSPGADGSYVMPNAAAVGVGSRPRLGSRSDGGGGGGGAAAAAAAAAAAEPSVATAAEPSVATAAEPPDLRPQPPGVLTAWVVESIRRDDSHDEEEMPAPGPMGRGPHPRCSPEQVVKAQLAALRRGDVAGAASYNVWSRSTSGGWDLHLSAFRAMLRQPSYHVLLTSYDAELGPSALPSMRRMVQEVRLLTSPSSQGGGGDVYGGGGGGGGGSSLVFGLCMQANGCWLVEGIRAVR